MRSIIVALFIFTCTITITESDNNHKNNYDQRIRGGTNSTIYRQQQQQQQQKYEDEEGHERKLYEGARRTVDTSTDERCMKCPESGAVSRDADFNPRESIFDQLNPSEFDSLVTYVTQDTNIADTTMDDVESSNDAFNSNYIVFMQLFPPPKTDAIEYIDGNSDTVPDRYAIVTIHRGRERPRDVMQYKIGPLVHGKVQQTENTVVEKLLRDNEIPWSMRGNYGPLQKFVEDQIYEQAYKLREVFKITTGGYCFGGDECDGDDRVTYIEYANLATTTTNRITNIFFIVRAPDRELGPSCLLPIPISFHIIENPNIAASRWETTNFEYCYQGPFESADALLVAIEQGEVERCTVSFTDTEWTST